MGKFYQYLWQPDALTQTESRQRRRLGARQCRPLLDQPRCSYIIRARRGTRRYGKSRSGTGIMEETACGKNMYVSQWKQSGFDCNDAMNSQALLQLRKQYCDAGRSLECRLCHWLLRSKERNLQRIMQNVFLFLRLNIDKAMFFC